MNKQTDKDSLSTGQVIFLMIIGAIAGACIIPIVILLASAFGL